MKERMLMTGMEYSVSKEEMEEDRCRWLGIQGIDGHPKLFCWFLYRKPDRTGNRVPDRNKPFFSGKGACIYEYQSFGRTLEKVQESQTSIRLSF
jgi:hypothetical protein